jgi:hypothetical protein
MGRTKGAMNRTPREIKKDGEFKLALSKLKEKNRKLRAENAAIKKARKAK